MSYCCWSSDNYKCDVYCYESADGYVTHVASGRYIGIDDIPPEPRIEDFTEETQDEWQQQYKARRAEMEQLPIEKIALPHAGESFIDSDATEMVNRLRWLAGLGYHVPEFVFDELNEEIAEGKTA